MVALCRTELSETLVTGGLRGIHRRGDPLCSHEILLIGELAISDLLTADKMWRFLYL